MTYEQYLYQNNGSSQLKSPVGNIANSLLSTGLNYIPVIGPILSSLFNVGSQLFTNKANMDINQQNIDYNRAVTQEQWERDDNAHQREVADLEAAGLSPLANTSGSQVTSGLSAPSPLAMQAPQVDSNALINAVLRSNELEEQKRHNLVVEGHKDSELILRAEEIQQKAEQLQIENKKVEADIKHQAELIKLQSQQLSETMRKNKEEEIYKQMSFESELFWKEVRQIAPEGCDFTPYYSKEEYKYRYEAWIAHFNVFVESLGPTSQAHGKSKAKNGSAGINLGANALGNGLNAGGNASGGYSDSTYDMENMSEYQKQELIKFYHEHPVPILMSRKYKMQRSDYD